MATSWMRPLDNSFPLDILATFWMWPLLDSNTQLRRYNLDLWLPWLCKGSNIPECTGHMLTLQECLVVHLPNIFVVL